MAPLYDIAIAEVYFDAGASTTFTIPEGRNIFFYVVRGNVEVNGAHQFQLVEFESEGAEITVTALSAAMILLGHCRILRHRGNWGL